MVSLTRVLKKKIRCANIRQFKPPLASEKKKLSDENLFASLFSDFIGQASDSSSSDGNTPHTAH